MIIAIALSMAGLGFAVWLLFTLAVYALPFFAGVSVGMLAYQSGAGAMGGLLIGLGVGAVTLIFGQMLFAAIRSPVLRRAVAAIYVAPAGLTGFHAVHGLSGIGGTSEPWRVGFAVVGALVIAGVAWSRVAAFYPGEPGRGDLSALSPPAKGGTAKEADLSVARGGSVLWWR